MRLLFLGTGGYHPNERRHTASLMFPELGIVFDAGTSLFRMPSHLMTKELDIFLTHSHLDHVVGLTYLIVPLLQQSITRCKVHAQPDTIAALKEHLFSQPLFPVLPPFEFIPLEDRVCVGNAINHALPAEPSGRLARIQARGRRGNESRTSPTPLPMGRTPILFAASIC